MLILKNPERFQLFLDRLARKYTYFQCFFNNSYLTLISSILHRSARCMISMVSRTCRFVATRNALYFQCVLTILLFGVMSTSRIVLSPMVLDTLSKRHQFCIIILFRNHLRNSRYSNFSLFFPNEFSMFPFERCLTLFLLS